MPKTRKNALRFEDVRFRAHISVHANSTFLGYADATLVVPSALGKDLDLKIRIRGLQVKILNGSFRIDFPSEQGNDGKHYPHLFPKTGETRVALTAALLADRMVNAVATTVLEDQAVARSQGR